MTEGLVFQTKIHFRAGRSGHKQLVRGEKPAEVAKPGRMPWVSKLMALGRRGMHRGSLAGRGFAVTSKFASHHKRQVECRC